MDRIRLPREATTRDFLAMIFRRKAVILLVMLAATALTAGRSLRAPVIYWSSTQVLLQGYQRSSSIESRVVSRPVDELVQSECNIAVSDPVISRAKELVASRRSTPTHQVDAKDVVINRNHLAAEPQGLASIIWIRYGGLSPDEAREVVTAITDAYLEVHREIFRLPDARNIMEDRLHDTEARMDRLARERRDFLMSEGFHGGEQEKAELITAIKRNDAELLTLRGDIAAQVEWIRAMKNAMASGDPESVPLGGDGGVSPGRSALITMSDQLVRLRARRTEIMAHLQAGHRDVQSVDAEIASMRENLKAGIASEIREAQARLDVLKARESTLLAGGIALQERLERIPELERRLGEYDQQLSALNDYYKDFKHGEFALTLNEETGRDFEAILLSPASRPQPDDPRDLVRLALGPGLGLIAGLGFALFLERMDHSVHSPADIEEFVELPVLASVGDTPWPTVTGVRRLRRMARSRMGDRSGS